MNLNPLGLTWEDRDPQEELDRMGIRLVSLMGEEAKVKVRSVEALKKSRRLSRELDRLWSSVNYGGGLREERMSFHIFFMKVVSWNVRGLGIGERGE